MDSNKSDREILSADIAHDIIGDIDDSLLLIEGNGRLTSHYPAANTWHTSYLRESEASTLPLAKREYNSIIMRLPKSHDRLHFILHTICYFSLPGSALYLYGFNDEGIKSAQKKCIDFFGNCTIVDYKKRCRVLSVTISEDTIQKNTKEPLTLDLFVEKTDLTIDETTTHPTVYYPGMFAKGKLDAATSLLLTHSPPFQENTHILDYGCGSGIIARHLGMRYPHTTWDLLDTDTLSLAASRENCRNITVQSYFNLDHIPPRGMYDHIISNPPMHTEKSEHTTIITDLITNAPKHLSPGGTLTIVVQSRLALERYFNQSFRSHTHLAQTSRFTVWHGIL